LICNYSLIFSQPEIEWQKCIGGSNNEEASDIIATDDGGYALTGRTSSNDGDVSDNHGGMDLWVLKLSSLGDIIWQRCYGGSYDEEGESIQQTSDGGYIALGRTYSNDGDVTSNNGNGDIWILKIDSTGELEWNKCFGGTDLERGYTIKQTSDDGYIFTGLTYSNNGDVSGNHGDSDVWVIKISSSGDLEWQKCFGGSGFDRPQSLTISSDNGFVILGETASNDGDVNGHIGGVDFWILKLDQDGILEWEKCYGGMSDESSEHITQTFDGGYILAGGTYSNDENVTGNNGNEDAFVLKIDPFGDIEWQKCLGGSNNEKAESIIETDDGYTFTGRSDSNDGDVSGNNGDSDMWVLKMDAFGNTEWQKCLGGSNNEKAESIIETDDGYALTGRTDSNDGDVSGNNGDSDVWVIKLTTSISSVKQKKDEPIQIYPNPARNLVNIRSGKNQDIEYVISSINGELMAKNKIYGNQVSVDLSSFRKGLYVININNQNYYILKE
tara:strand:+ start:918 stop:2408 length:1491 start_codon:yes stop_codon:yes gene_type:complete